MKLLVAIPTWNRADYLDKAIGTIAMARSRTRNCEIEMFISDNLSSDHTPEVVARWQEHSPWIHARRWEEHTGHWPEILKRVFMGSNREFDYVWLQGDDDWITDSQAYIKLAEAIEASKHDPPAVVHCCQTRRSLPGDDRVFSGITEDLCNIYGWHDLLGWISGLVISRDTMERMLVSPQLEIKPPSAYCHSEALLEAAYGKNMLIIAAGLIDPQDKEQTPECIERWAKANTGEAYWRIITGLLNLRQRGVLRKPLTLGFFRYLTYSFWDRFAVEVMTLASNSETSDELLEIKLSLLGYFTILLGYGEDRKLFGKWLHGFKDEVHEVRRVLRLIRDRIESFEQSAYTWSLIPPSAEEPRGTDV